MNQRPSPSIQLQHLFTSNTVPGHHLRRHQQVAIAVEPQSRPPLPPDLPDLIPISNSPAQHPAKRTPVPPLPSIVTGAAAHAHRQQHDRRLIKKVPPPTERNNQERTSPVKIIAQQHGDDLANSRNDDIERCMKPHRDTTPTATTVFDDEFNPHELTERRVSENVAADATLNTNKFDFDKHDRSAVFVAGRFPQSGGGTEKDCCQAVSALGPDVHDIYRNDDGPLLLPLRVAEVETKTNERAHARRTLLQSSTTPTQTHAHISSGAIDPRSRPRPTPAVPRKCLTNDFGRHVRVTNDGDDVLNARRTIAANRDTTTASSHSVGVCGKVYTNIYNDASGKVAVTKCTGDAVDNNKVYDSGEDQFATDANCYYSDASRCDSDSDVNRDDSDGSDSFTAKVSKCGNSENKYSGVAATVVQRNNNHSSADDGGSSDILLSDRVRLQQQRESDDCCDETDNPLLIRSDADKSQQNHDDEYDDQDLQLDHQDHTKSHRGSAAGCVPGKCTVAGRTRNLRAGNGRNKTTGALSLKQERLDSAEEDAACRRRRSNRSKRFINQNLLNSTDQDGDNSARSTRRRRRSESNASHRTRCSSNSSVRTDSSAVNVDPGPGTTTVDIRNYPNIEDDTTGSSKRTRHRHQKKRKRLDDSFSSTCSTNSIHYYNNTTTTTALSVGSNIDGARYNNSTPAGTVKHKTKRQSNLATAAASEAFDSGSSAGRGGATPKTNTRHHRTKRQQAVNNNNNANNRSSRTADSQHQRHRKTNKRQQRGADRPSLSGGAIVPGDCAASSGAAGAAAVGGVEEGGSSSAAAEAAVAAAANSGAGPIKPSVRPVFLWVRERDCVIVDVRCEDYDRRNRIRLTKTAPGVWRAVPRTEQQNDNPEDTTGATEANATKPIAGLPAVVKVGGGGGKHDAKIGHPEHRHGRREAKRSVAVGRDVDDGGNADNGKRGKETDGRRGGGKGIAAKGHRHHHHHNRTSDKTKSGETGDETKRGVSGKSHRRHHSQSHTTASASGARGKVQSPDEDSINAAAVKKSPTVISDDDRAKKVTAATVSVGKKSSSKSHQVSEKCGIAERSTTHGAAADATNSIDRTSTSNRKSTSKTSSDDQSGTQSDNKTHAVHHHHSSRSSTSHRHKSTQDGLLKRSSQHRRKPNVDEQRVTVSKKANSETDDCKTSGERLPPPKTPTDPHPGSAPGANAQTKLYKDASKRSLTRDSETMTTAAPDKIQHGAHRHKSQDESKSGTKQRSEQKMRRSSLPETASKVNQKHHHGREQHSRPENLDDRKIAGYKNATKRLQSVEDIGVKCDKEPGQRRSHSSKSISSDDGRKSNSHHHHHRVNSRDRRKNVQKNVSDSKLEATARRDNKNTATNPIVVLKNVGDSDEGFGQQLEDSRNDRHRHGRKSTAVRSGVHKSQHGKHRSCDKQEARDASTDSTMVVRQHDNSSEDDDDDDDDGSDCDRTRSNTDLTDPTAGIMDKSCCHRTSTTSDEALGMGRRRRTGSSCSSEECEERQQEEFDDDGDDDVDEVEDEEAVESDLNVPERAGQKPYRSVEKDPVNLFRKGSGEHHHHHQHQCCCTGNDATSDCDSKRDSKDNRGTSIVRRQSLDEYSSCKKSSALKRVALKRSHTDTDDYMSSSSKHHCRNGDNDDDEYFHGRQQDSISGVIIKRAKNKRKKKKRSKHDDLDVTNTSGAACGGHHHHKKSFCHPGTEPKKLPTKSTVPSALDNLLAVAELEFHRETNQMPARGDETAPVAGQGERDVTAKDADGNDAETLIIGSEDYGEDDDPLTGSAPEVANIIDRLPALSEDSPEDDDMADDFMENDDVTQGDDMRHLIGEESDKDRDVAAYSRETLTNFERGACSGSGIEETNREFFVANVTASLKDRDVVMDRDIISNYVDIIEDIVLPDSMKDCVAHVLGSHDKTDLQHDDLVDRDGSDREFAVENDDLVELDDDDPLVEGSRAGMDDVTGDCTDTRMIDHDRTDPVTDRARHDADQQHRAHDNVTTSHVTNNADSGIESNRSSGDFERNAGGQVVNIIGVGAILIEEKRNRSEDEEVCGVNIEHSEHSDPMLKDDAVLNCDRNECDLVINDVTDYENSAAASDNAKLADVSCEIQRRERDGVFNNTKQDTTPDEHCDFEQETNDIKQVETVDDQTTARDDINLEKDDRTEPDQYQDDQDLCATLENKVFEEKSEKITAVSVLDLVDMEAEIESSTIPTTNTVTQLANCNNAGPETDERKNEVLDFRLKLEANNTEIPITADEYRTHRDKTEDVLKILKQEQEHLSTTLAKKEDPVDCKGDVEKLEADDCKTFINDDEKSEDIKELDTSEVSRSIDVKLPKHDTNSLDVQDIKTDERLDRLNESDEQTVQHNLNAVDFTVKTTATSEEEIALETKGVEEGEIIIMEDSEHETEPTAAVTVAPEDYCSKDSPTTNNRTSRPEDKVQQSNYDTEATIPHGAVLPSITVGERTYIKPLMQDDVPQNLVKKDQQPPQVQQQQQQDISDMISEDEFDMQPTDLSVKKRLSASVVLPPPPHAESEDEIDEVFYYQDQPQDLSCPQKRRRPQTPMDTAQSPQPSGIPLITSPSTSKSQFLESLLASPSPQMTFPTAPSSTGGLQHHQRQQQQEPPSRHHQHVNISTTNTTDRGANPRKSASPTVSCSSEDLIVQQDRKTVAGKRQRKSLPVPLPSEPDALTQLRALIWALPDPMLIPRERLSAILQSPAREIPLLLALRPELRLPEAFARPSVMRDPDILVVSLGQLESMLLRKQQREQDFQSINQWLQYFGVGGMTSGVSANPNQLLMAQQMMAATSQQQQQFQQHNLQQQQQSFHQNMMCSWQHAMRPPAANSNSSAGKHHASKNSNTQTATTTGQNNNNASSLSLQQSSARTVPLAAHGFRHNSFNSNNSNNNKPRVTCKSLLNLLQPPGSSVDQIDHGATNQRPHHQQSSLTAHHNLNPNQMRMQPMTMQQHNHQHKSASTSSSSVISTMLMAAPTHQRITGSLAQQYRHADQRLHHQQQAHQQQHGPPNLSSGGSKSHGSSSTSSSTSCSASMMPPQAARLAVRKNLVMSDGVPEVGSTTTCPDESLPGGSGGGTSGAIGSGGMTVQPQAGAGGTQPGQQSGGTSSEQGQNATLWHPLFGNQKNYAASPWNWTTLTVNGE